MNRLVTRIGIGIAIYLSSSVVDSLPSLATSLTYSDRFELTISEEESLLSPQLYLFPNSLNSDNTSQPSSQESSDFDFADNPRGQEFSESQNIEDLNDLISPSEWKIQIQTAISESEKGNFNLLDSLAKTFQNLQVDSLEENSFVNPSVIILPQVAYENIYQGLYDFEINLAANTGSTAPRVVENSSIPEELLITQESIVNYTPAFLASQSGNATNSSYITPNRYASRGESNNNFLGRRNINSRLNNNSYEDLSTKVRSVLSNNVNVFTNIDDIEIQSQYKSVNAAQKFNAQKSSRQKELEEKMAEQREVQEEKRKKLLEQLERRAEQRERRREQERIKLAKQRENRLDRLRNQQVRELQRQRNRYSNR